MDNPFVSFIVMTYNAERYVKEAIEGAFEQTYENMEIIISDDCSTDNTFEVIQETVAQYKGSKPCRVLRNEQNIGIGAHLNKLWWEEAKGDWIIPSAGDDVSLPHRTERMMKEAKEMVSFIHASHYKIDSIGKNIDYVDDFHKRHEIFERKNLEEIILSGICVRGNCMAINKKKLHYFDPFIDDLVNEDVILAYRTAFAGNLVYIDEPLVKYRIHDVSISFTTANKINYVDWATQKKDTISKVSRQLLIFEQIEQDNKIMKLDNLLCLQPKKDKTAILGFLYSNLSFSPYMLLSWFFYKESIKRILYPILYRVTK